MARSAEKSRRLTVFLLKDTVKKTDDALEPEDEKHWEMITFDPRTEVEGSFYWSSRPPGAPEWVSFVKPFIGEPPDKLRTASASGLLVLKVQGRFFAVTFGYGRSLLDLDKIEPQFGLKVCLNRIDPTQMRSMDTKTYEDVVVAKRTQVSKNSDIPAFGIDVSSDILRAVTGTPLDPNFAKTMSGSDGLVINRVFKPEALVDFCRQLLTAFQEDRYKENFSWIDDLKPVVDKEVIAQLDGTLLSQLQSGDTTFTYLAIPDVMDWEDVDVFRIAGTHSKDYSDLDLDEYLDDLGEQVSNLRIEEMKSRSVSVRYTGGGDFSSRWKLYKCLVSEQHLDGKLHVLMEGRWFAVTDTLVDAVDAYCGHLTQSAVNLPASTRDEKEEDYNKRLANTDPSHLLRLDAKIKRPGGASSGIELCDVMTSAGEFIHVKRKSRSSTLSHLFAQRSVSAATFIGDGEFRDKIRAEIENNVAADCQQQWLDLIPPSGQLVTRASYTVSYAIIAPAKIGQPWLPFFSKLNLMQHGKLLENNLGMKVAVSRIDIAESGTSNAALGVTAKKE